MAGFEVLLLLLILPLLWGQWSVLGLSVLGVSKGVTDKEWMTRGTPLSLKKHWICLYCSRLQKKKCTFEIIYIIISMTAVTAST